MRQVRREARRFRSYEAARAAGFHRRRDLKRRPLGVFHLWHQGYETDGRVMDPRRPESLVWWRGRAAGAEPILIAFMLRAPLGAPPTTWGRLPLWHTHGRGRDQMTHVWLTRSLRTALANCLPVHALEAALPGLHLEDLSYGHHIGQPCPRTRRSRAIAAAAPRVRVGDNYFSPSSLTVARGTRVTWSFSGDDAHNVTVTKGPVRFRSPTRSSGTYSRRMRKPGTYRIVCSIHAGKQRMRLTVR
jgi:plastocyanin